MGIQTEKKLTFCLRPVRENDFVSIGDIAKKVGPGFTSLPDDHKTIEDKIQRSLKSFAQQNAKEAGFFFFVLEEIDSGKIVGTSAIEANAAFLSPFYNYTIVPMTQSSEVMHQRVMHQTLFLSTQYQEASVLCSLYLDASLRGRGLGPFLSRARFLFMAEFPALFSDVIIAELRGVFNKEGISPFWEALGKKFFHSDFHDANFRRSTQSAQFITDLVPQQGVYLDLLPIDASAVIGKPHDNTKPDLHILEKEGFHFRNVIDIFDAGPIIEASRDGIKTIKESMRTKVLGFKENSAEISGEVMLISNTAMDFRSTISPEILLTAEGVYLTKSLGKTLHVNVGDTLRYCPLR